MSTHMHMDTCAIRFQKYLMGLLHGCGDPAGPNWHDVVVHGHSMSGLNVAGLKDRIK